MSAVQNQDRALRVFAKCAMSAMYLADCHPKYIAASRRMHRLRDAYQLNKHPQWSVIATAVKARRAKVVRGL